MIRTSSTNQTDFLYQSIILAEGISSAIGTKIHKQSHWKYWLQFMHLVNEDVQAFRSTDGVLRASRQTRQAKDLNTLKSIFTQIVFRPRQKRKSHNTAPYARKVIASVKDEYERHLGRAMRRPGNDLNVELFHLEKGLSKVAPSQEKPRLPVLQYHMRAVRRTMDLKDNQLDRVLWALWCTQFQGVLQASDLIRPVTEKPRDWDPSLYTNRERVIFNRIRGESHAEGNMRMEISLKPIKNDHTGVKAVETQMDPCVRRIFSIYPSFTTNSNFSLFEALFRIISPVSDNPQPRNSQCRSSSLPPCDPSWYCPFSPLSFQFI